MKSKTGPAYGMPEEAARAATVAAIEWVKSYWPGLLGRLMKSEDERVLLDLGRLMLAYAYGKPREMIEHSGEVVHSYVVEAPSKSVTVGEWEKTPAVKAVREEMLQAYVPPANENEH